MILEGRLFKANLLLAQSMVELAPQDRHFSHELEQNLIALCRSLDIPVPLWLSKNTTEFARFHQTVFFSEQFTDKVNFDRFQIKWEDDGR
ncbi:MAG: hypothetical protein PHR21_07035 [Oscillospiraceae bacterium]|nr:hypothetical protein [Oscillospiraceae bacterium]MDD4368426.1 hypothetical protein [Oscillospiraceae bacterium]